MLFHYELTTNTLYQDAERRAEIDEMSAKRGTDRLTRIQFLRDGTPERLPLGTAIRLMGKEEGKFDGDAVIFTDEFERPETEDGYYNATVSYNTTALNTLLGSPDGDDTNDIASVTLIAEISYRTLDASNPEKSNTFDIIVENAVDNGDESEPISAGPNLGARVSELETNVEDLEGRVSPLEEAIGPIVGYFATPSDGRNALGASSGVWPVSLGGTGVSSLPKFSVHKNDTGQTVATATTTKLTWSTEEYDTGSWFNTGTSKAIAPRAGTVIFNVSVMPLNHGASVQLRLWLYKNGSPYRRLGNIYTSVSSGNTQVSGTSVVQVAQNDEFEVYFYHENGSDLEVFGNSAATYWEAAYIP